MSVYDHVNLRTLFKKRNFRILGGETYLILDIKKGDVKTKLE